jgi:hypothetical protein
LVGVLVGAVHLVGKSGGMGWTRTGTLAVAGG